MHGYSVTYHVAKATFLPLLTRALVSLAVLWWRSGTAERVETKHSCWMWDRKYYCKRQMIRVYIYIYIICVNYNYNTLTLKNNVQRCSQTFAMLMCWVVSCSGSVLSDVCPGESALNSAPLAPVEQGDPNLDKEDEMIDGGFRIKQAAWRRASQSHDFDGFTEPHGPAIWRLKIAWKLSRPCWCLLAACWNEWE